MKNSVISWQDRANLSIAQGALTNSKRPSVFVEGVYPTHTERAQGCFIYATNGQRYIDFIGGLGTNLLGYGNQEIKNAVIKVLDSGLSPSLPTTLEVQLAEKLKEFFPWVDRWRFLKTGSEVCQASLRIARAYVKDDYAISEHYHGWSDEFVRLTEPAIGVPKGYDHFLFKHNGELDSLKSKIFITEPVATDASQDRFSFLKQAKERASFIINDEIITGFRYKSFAVSNHHSLNPDLICLGKAIAGGLPLAALGGRASVMECDEYFVSSTFAGEAASLAASLKFLELIKTKFDINELWEMGERFQGEFNAMNGGVKIKGYATRGVLEGEPLQKALFMQEACKAGLLFGPSWFITFAHKDVLDDALKICESVFFKIKNGMAKLEGKMPSSPFAERMRK